MNNEFTITEETDQSIMLDTKWKNKLFWQRIDVEVIPKPWKHQKY